MYNKPKFALKINDADMVFDFPNLNSIPYLKTKLCLFRTPKTLRRLAQLKIFKTGKTPS
jgi:hypothetical protein